MFATIKNLIPEPRQADPVPPASPVPSEEPEKADTAAA
jgi:hypothetical protein